MLERGKRMRGGQRKGGILHRGERQERYEGGGGGGGGGREKGGRSEVGCPSPG